MYAVGYANDELGNNKLLANINGTLVPSYDILTGTATSGDTSNWAMKLTPVAGTYAPTLENGYNNYSVVPSTQTKVATFNSITDTTSGSAFNVAYASYVNQLQPAGTYNGKVKFTMVHPNDANPPIDPMKVAYLDTGYASNSKMADIATNSKYIEYGCDDYLNSFIPIIRSIKKGSVLPSDFTPSAGNTISLDSSPKPVYIYYDDSDSTIYYYSDAEVIYMNSDSSYLFDFIGNYRDNCYFGISDITDVSGLAGWDAKYVKNMDSMFQSTQISDLTPLKDWNVGNVTNMAYMFYSTKISDLTPLANWDTGNIESVVYMFAEIPTLVNPSPIFGWDVSKVNNFHYMFGGSTPKTNLPIFTSRPGTWNYYGTYIPNP